MSWSAEEELEQLPFDFEPPCLMSPDLYGTSTIRDQLGHPHVLTVSGDGVLGWMCVRPDGTYGPTPPGPWPHTDA
ncbi:MAG TPA: hypothetical protein VGY32_11545 [Solirubrobacteraceae bacterium]|jgi:hypothetical protein|nr:hypothetical protein [Solirubrobacteraceae bacterium]